MLTVWLKCISTGCEDMVVIETHGDRLSEAKARAIEQKNYF